MNRMSLNLSVVDKFLVSLIIKEHHVDEDEEDAAVTLHTHAPLEEDEEDEITKQRQQEDNLRNEAQQDVLDISEMAGHKDKKCLWHATTAVMLQMNVFQMNYISTHM